jgi:hypothetical protein
MREQYGAVKYKKFIFMITDLSALAIGIQRSGPIDRQGLKSLNYTNW